MMTPEQINIKIAEACDWNDVGFSPSWDAVIGTRYEEGTESYASTPDYCTDLNAMHEAEKVLADPQTDTYLDMLAQVCGHQYKPESERNEHLFWCWNATARQRAEAFLRALNKWEEEA